MDIILLFFLCRSIAKLAKSKGRNPFLWVIYTIISWIFCEGIGLNIALGRIGFGEITTYNQLMTVVLNHPGIVFFSLFCAFGGYLLVRFVLEKIEARETN